MKGYAMLGIGKTGFIEKEKPHCGPLDAVVRPIAVSAHPIFIRFTRARSATGTI